MEPAVIVKGILTKQEQTGGQPAKVAIEIPEVEVDEWGIIQQLVKEKAKVTLEITEEQPPLPLSKRNP